MKIQNTSFSKSKEHPSFLVHGDGTGDSDKMEKRALKLQAEAQVAGYFCVAGIIHDEGYGLYLVPVAGGIRSVIEEFGVGSHADAKPDSVFGEIAEANRLNPLVPYFADPAGLKAKFSKPITEEVIDALEANLRNAETMMDEDEGTITDYIRKNKLL